MERWPLSFSSLRAQFALLLTLALFPLGLISLAQTAVVLEDARELSRSALLSRTIAAAGEERRLIERALGAASGLEAVPRTTNGQTCSDLMAQFIALNPLYAFAGFLPADGVMTCSSAGGRFDFSDDPSLGPALAAGEAFIEVNPAGSVTGQSVLIVNHPVIENDTILGFVSISFPHELAEAALLAKGSGDHLQLATLNVEGTVLAATTGRGNGAALLPADLTIDDLFSRTGETFVALGAGGADRLFAVSELVDNAVLIVGSWPVTGGPTGGFTTATLLPLLFPVLMWFASMGVGVFGVNRLVTRHVTELNSAMRQYALGEREDIGLALDGAAEELQAAGRAFSRMSLVLSQAEKQREQDLHDKEVLLREVHHRVKNNLQLIASIMNMHARSAETPETHIVLQGLQRRLRSMAMLHRTLYTTSEMTTVDSAALISTLIKETVGLAQSRNSDLVIEKDLESVHLYPDQAMPLSMLAAELLVNATKYVGRPPSGPPRIAIRFVNVEGDLFEFTLENTLGTRLSEDEEPGTGVGEALTRAFVAQLDGTQDVDVTMELYRFSVRFHVAEFVSDEEGMSGATER